MKQNIERLAKGIVEQLEGRLDPIMKEAVESKIHDLGLDKVDRRPGMFSESDVVLSPADKAAQFIRGALLRVTPSDPSVRKALSGGSDGAGGYLVPTEYRAELLKRLPEISELFPHVRSVPVITDSGEYPRLSSDVSISWGRAENADISSTDPAFSQLTWTVRNMSAITFMSRELVDDSNPGIIDIITALFNEAVAAERDKMIAVGDGVNQPEGISVTIGLESLDFAGPLTFEKLVEMKYALARKYHRNARWIFSSANLQRITGLTDDNGRPIIRDALVAGETPSILGRPFSVQDDLSDEELYFGDLSKYIWFDRQRMVIESTATGGDTFRKHQVAIKVVERCDGKVGLTEAFVKGVNIADETDGDPQ